MGVKSLWSLLTPVSRPVMHVVLPSGKTNSDKLSVRCRLETIEGKAMAIDSSIWIYQFQATMRDKDGRALVNAHLLGFLRRICKLLFYGIKPVFVFDGGAPALKRMTITERKKKKTGAAASHVKLAEKLLAAQMRKEALNHAQPPQPTTSKGKGPAGPAIIDDNAVYLEDIDNSAPKTPAKKQKVTESSTSSSKKNRFHDHDPYRLPEVNLEEVVAKTTRSAVPDPRLATEEELRAFIEDMRPEDFDVTSPAFRELPTEVQYEIVGDLRLKSRQTSYKRLQTMLKNAPTPIDFSRQQIQNLKQRNALTQQLLTTTDSIGKAHISIPVRIASERNKEYVLMKNEGDGGGWILGIRDDGTRTKPIEIDKDPPEVDDNDSDSGMEEVDIPAGADPDPDLREYRREMALSAIGKRYSPKKLAPLQTKPIMRKAKAKPLFDLDLDDEMRPLELDLDSDNDEDLAFAIQESLDQEKAKAHQQPQTPSSKPPWPSSPPSVSRHEVGNNQPMSSPVDTNGLFVEDDDDEGLYAPAARLETALAIGNAGPSPRRPSFHGPSSRPLTFGQPILLNSFRTAGPLMHFEGVVTSDTSSSDGDMEEIAVQPVQKTVLDPQGILPSSDANSSLLLEHSKAPAVAVDTLRDGSDDGGVPFSLVDESLPTQESGLTVERSLRTQVERIVTPVNMDALSEPAPHTPWSSPHQQPQFENKDLGPSSLPQVPGSLSRTTNMVESDEENLTEWSRSPSPVGGPLNATASPRLPSHSVNWDAAQEMDPHAEEGEYALFMSQVKGRDIDTVRKEIDEEIKSLNHQRRAAMRDSEDVTQQMISQIMVMLRLFGIPYITAPMEAEAQCAELVSLGLVDGIITDDSDVFLFGGLRVFKNMFNQSKTVECFLLSDITRDLGLDRDSLVRLAYLLGSDYVEGLSGVGPVVAMELLKEFPGVDGLHKFKDWWIKVQTGKDGDEDNKSKFRKRFKKKFKDLYLPNDWPNPAVRDGYYHPTVDESDEPFKWGLPDLDALRDFLHGELGWNQTKVDDLLLPIIQKMGKRRQTAALNKQGNLNEYFDIMAGNGVHAPRKRQAYASKRLQQVVSDFRKGQGRSIPSPDQEMSSESGDDAGPSAKKAKISAARKGKGKGHTATPTRGRDGKSRGRRKTRSTKSKEVSAPESGDDEDEYDGSIGGGHTGKGSPPPLRVELRPRPKPTPAYKGNRVAESASA